MGGIGVFVALVGLIGVTAAVMGGGKKKGSGGSSGGGYSEPTPAGKSADEWKQWFTNEVIRGAQLADPSAIEAIAKTIENAIPQMPSSVQGLARQAVQALRSQAAALRVDTGADIPPNPPYVPPSPPPRPPVVTSPGQPQPPSAPAGKDWRAWVQEKVIAGGMNPAIANSVADEIQRAMPQIPTAIHPFAYEAITALRAAAASAQGSLPAAPAPRPPEPPDPIVDHRTALAQDTAQMLKVNGGAPANRYKEDENLVRQYQLQEGLTADGKYGVGTGLTMPKYGIVPPRPYYFSSNATRTREAKAEWKSAMNRYAAADPARRAEWLAAANVDSL